MQKLHHPNIVQYMGCQRDSNTLDVLQEYVTGGSLAKLLAYFGPFPEPLVQVYTRQICAGLAYLHENMIIHRDIKSANCLVTGEGQIKLADFGCSKTIETAMTVDQGASTLTGTPKFAALSNLLIPSTLLVILFLSHSLFLSLVIWRLKLCANKRMWVVAATFGHWAALSSRC